MSPVTHSNIARKKNKRGRWRRHSNTRHIAISKRIQCDLVQYLYMNSFFENQMFIYKLIKFGSMIVAAQYKRSLNKLCLFSFVGILDKIRKFFCSKTKKNEKKKNN